LDWITDDLNKLDYEIPKTKLGRNSFGAANENENEIRSVAI